METNCASRIHRFFPPLRPESGHLLHLDALRLIASAGIVVFHMATFLDAGSVSQYLLKSTRSFRLFVDMFFAVSGFVIAFVYLAKITTLRKSRPSDPTDHFYESGSQDWGRYTG
jgi:peptidoglycan/LPS O-acetylase OafA/YrhL